ncbi:MAG: precorrin-8X methylmutase [Deltaproteobacteria bacterium]|jgi:precorrin-8X/cobalt-precorrin-8 methylmutase|nr:precorrin-8X methylmutase [Deltaproteobacteria bacterium]
MQNATSGKPDLIQCFTPEEIERRSFEIIEAELAELVRSGKISDALPFSGPVWEVARRLVHTSADYSLLPQMHIPETAVNLGVAALRSGAHIFTDTEMVRVGMPLRRLTPLGASAICLHTREGVGEYARQHGVTRSRAGMELAAPKLGGAVLAIGNAPTALLAFLDLLDAGKTELPALIIAMPVGFVNAAESKELLLQRPELAERCIAIRGRRGGSPLAAAAVNALAEMALR